jgi:hypothetical protein
MGFMDIFGGSTEKKFRTLDAEISKARGKIHLGGIKGQALHKNIRAAFTKLHFKWIQKKENKLEQDIEKFKADIEQHLVLSSETHGIKAIEMMVKEYSLLYLTMHSLMLYEKYDLQELSNLIEKMTKMQQKKHIDKDVILHIASMLKDEANAWKDDIEKLRMMINSVFEKSEGKAGWALTTFQAMHKEGFFIRYQERSKFRDLLKDEKKIEKALKMIESKDQIKTIDDLKKVMGTVETEEKEMANTFTVIYKMLLNSWNHITDLMAMYLELNKGGMQAHELPAAFVEKMGRLHDIIMKNLDQEYLHALRIDDKQLEGEYGDVLKRIEALKASA